MLKNNVKSICKSMKNNDSATTNYRKPKHTWHKSVIIEHPKTSLKLSKVIRQTEKVSEVSRSGNYSDSPSYSDTEKSGNNLDENNPKVYKWSHAYKVLTSTYRAEFFNSFNHKVQLKDTEFATRNKLIDFFNKLKSFTIVTTLVLELKN